MRLKLIEGQTYQVNLDDVTDVVEGKYRVDLSKVLAQPGLQWKSGHLTLERHPELRIKAAPGRPAPYWDLRSHPMVAGLLRRVTNVLGGTDYRLDKPTLPGWYEGSHLAEAALERQYEYCARVFHGWLQGGRNGWMGFVRSAITTTVIQGFSWYEIVAQPRVLTLGTKQHEVWWPEIPHWRAPWSIRHWLTDKEALLGLVAEYNYQTDYMTKKAEKARPMRVVIPKDKILLLTSNALGPSDYTGRSYLRDCYNEIKAYREAFQVEALGVEVNAIGELFFKLPPGGVSETSQTRLEEYLLNRRSSHAPGAILPDGVDVVRLSGEVPNLGEYSDRLTRAIAQCFNQDDRLIAVAQAGSFAARQSASSDVRDSMDDYIRELLGEPIEELFGRLIKATWPRDVEAGLLFVPKLAHGQVEEVDNAAYVSTLSAARQAKILSWTKADENIIRKMLDLTPLEQAEDGLAMAEDIDLAGYSSDQKRDNVGKWSKGGVKQSKGKKTIGKTEVSTRAFALPGGKVTIWENSPWAGDAHSVYDFVVDEDQRGQGIGSKLIDAVIKEYDGEEISAQVSTMASLKVFFNKGFRPGSAKPGASFDDLVKMFKDDYGSLNMRLNAKKVAMSEDIDLAGYSSDQIRDLLGKWSSKGSSAISSKIPEPAKPARKRSKKSLKAIDKIKAGKWETSPEGFMGSLSCEGQDLEDCHNKHPEMTTAYSKEDLEKMDIYKVEGMSAGFALKERDGKRQEIVSVHNNEPGVRGIGKMLMETAIKNGGCFLDHFATPTLNNLYERMGFVEYDRWDFDPQYVSNDYVKKYGKTDVVLRKHKNC